MTRALALACALALATPAVAQSVRTPAEMARDFIFTAIATPAEPGAIPLYAGVAPGSAGTAIERWNVMGNGQRIVRNVVRPTITPFLPDPKIATGAAVIVAPGGGFKMLSMDNEGWPVAKWLASRGIAAFVLKYRLNETPADETGFMREMGAVFAAATAGKGGQRQAEEPRATADALQALKMVRADAAKWRIDPARTGMVGFSAGAMATLGATLASDPAARPAFVGYIYGPMVAVDVPSDAPPMFVALALDDGLFGRQGFGIVESWHKAMRPVEFHAYERGDHGFGLGRAGTTTMGWLPQFHGWLDARGLLKK